MADDKDKTTAPPKGAAPSTASATPGAKPAPSGAARDAETRSGARTGGTTETAAAEYETLGVNPALDNRTGRQRPQASALAAKPQQYPGPEVGHFAEHAEQHGAAFDEAFGVTVEPAEGMHARGPHGRASDRLVHDAQPDGNPAAPQGAAPVAHDEK